MNFLHKIMDKLGRYRLIPDRRTGETYMHRYYLFLKDRKTFPFNITLHKIMKSDDPIMHDHPWNYITLILSGGYWEHTPVYENDKIVGEVSEWRGPGSIINRSADEFHWLELDENVGPATTLFFMGAQQRDWGFLVDRPRKKPLWIQWENYLNNFKEYHKKYIEPKIVKSYNRKKP